MDTRKLSQRRESVKPSVPERIAAEIFGADDLLLSAAWHLRNNPRRLARIQNQYRDTCLALLAEIRAAQRAA